MKLSLVCRIQGSVSRAQWWPSYSSGRVGRGGGIRAFEEFYQTKVSPQNLEVIFTFNCFTTCSIVFSHSRILSIKHLQVNDICAGSIDSSWFELKYDLHTIECAHQCCAAHKLTPAGHKEWLYLIFICGLAYLCFTFSINKLLNYPSVLIWRWACAVKRRCTELESEMKCWKVRSWCTVGLFTPATEMLPSNPMARWAKAFGRWAGKCWT